MFKIDHSLEDLCGKNIIIYRSIIGRKPEVLKVLDCPINLRDVKLFLHRGQYDEVFNLHVKIQNYIPEYQDLMEEIKNKKHNEDRFWLSLSYFPQTAIYDPVTKKVLTIYGINCKCLCEELLPKANEKEIIDIILKYCDDNNIKNDLL